MHEVELLLSDIHIPYQDKKALKKALDYGRAVYADTIVILGDLIDFYQVSSWSKDPNKFSVDKEIKTCKEWFEELRDLFPDASIFFLEGNHEERFKKFLWNKAPQLSSMEELEISSLLELGRFKIEYISNKKILEETGKAFSIKNLFHLHGHELNIGAGAVNIARNAFLKAQKNIVIGHFHTSQFYTHKAIDGSFQTSWVVGCLSNLNPDFCPVQNWMHGFAVVYYEGDSFKVENKKIIDGRIF